MDAFAGEDSEIKEIVPVNVDEDHLRQRDHRQRRFRLGDFAHKVVYHAPADDGSVVLLNYHRAIIITVIILIILIIFNHF